MPHLELLPAAAHYSVLIVCGALTEITCCPYRVWNINLYTGVFVKIRENPNEWLISCFVLFLVKTRVEIQVKLQLKPPDRCERWTHIPKKTPQKHTISKHYLNTISQSARVSLISFLSLFLFLFFYCNHVPPSLGSTSHVTFPWDQPGSK